MSLINIYLSETPLTSTKNRLLEKGPCIKLFKAHSFKQSLKSELFSPRICLTKNRFLLDDPLYKDKDHGSQKKKKKKKKIIKSTKKKLEFRSKPESFIHRSMPRHTQLRRRRLCSLALDSVNENLQLSESSSSDALSPSESRFIQDAVIEEESCPVARDTTDHVPRAQAVFLSTPQSALSGRVPNQRLQAPLLSTRLACSFGDFTFGSVRNNHLSQQNTTFSAQLPRAFYQTSENVPEKFISEMPSYNLEVLNLFEEAEFEFSSQSYDSNCENLFVNAKRKKMQLLNVISMALMFSSNLKNETDSYRLVLQNAIGDVMLIDPEFILKVALYARQELQIRAVSNFLLSYAASDPNSRIYLEKYFEASIVLPSDWIQVAEFYQIFNNKSLPAALRRAMKKCFQKFDKYQLAKYNRVETRKKRKIQEVLADGLDNENTSDEESENKQPAMKSFTLKTLIRSLHIDTPSEHVMCLLEKKYPETQAEFVSSGLPGVWDPEKSGKRMKLPIPETWETQVSAYGNKPHVWESLIDNDKLPYMATLRNLRNLILSGISSSHHQKVISNLQNKKYVINSRQLPMQYFEAYKVLSNLEKMADEDTYYKDFFSDDDVRLTPSWKKSKFQKMKRKARKISTEVVEEYKKAVSKALEISSMNNLHPIPGRTLIICDIDSNEFGSANKVKTCNTCIMMGLMCLKACEDSKMCIFSSAKGMDEISLKEADQFLDILMETCEKYEFLKYERYSSSDTSIPVSKLKTMFNSYLRSQNMSSSKLDHVIFLQMSTGDMEVAVTSFLHKYRELVNSDLLYTNVNFNLRNNSFSGQCVSEKDAYVCGSSNSLIKFIAERSSGGQLFYVENIDVKYNLPEIPKDRYYHPIPKQPEEPVTTEISNPLNCRMPKWRTLRIFISSTFKDMMSERDLLIRYVFPELKRRAASVFTKIVEVDLRWGITESDSSSKRAAEICLIEAQKADIFVGILGDRYGTIYSFEPPDLPELNWVKDCPKGLSITELEIQAACLRKPKESLTTSFFYFRNIYFIKHVPKKWARYFISEDFESKTKVVALKEKIKSANFKVLDGYPCHFSGIYDNKPVLAGLDVLGNIVLNDLWKKVQEIQKKEPYSDNIFETEIHHQSLTKSKTFFIEQKNFTRENIANKIRSEEGVFVIYGNTGCGKTTFLINLIPCLKTFTILKFFIGVSPRSRDLSYIIEYLCRSTCHELGSSVATSSLPADIVSYFPDFLQEVSNCCGGREIIFLIDGLDRLEENDQRLDWLPLFLPKRIKVICSASSSSLAFKVLCERGKLDSPVSFFEMPPLLLPEREQIVRNYLGYYRKVLEESAFSNNMMKIVSKKDSSNPFYLQIVCDFLRIYGSFENLEQMLRNLPSSLDAFFQEIILQMENEFDCILIQNVLTLLCNTKEGLEDADLHYVLSFVTTMNDLRSIPAFDELRKKIALLEPEKFLSQVKYSSLISTICTFAYGQLRQESFSLVGTEFEKAVKKFYRNKNFASNSKSLHCILAAYYHNICDLTNDGRYKVRSGFALRSLLYHMFYGGLYKEMIDLLCDVNFLQAIFVANADRDLLEYYSFLLADVLQSDQRLHREIDSSILSSFYEFVSRNFHIFHKYPDLLIQQAVNELSSLSKIKRKQNKYYLLENLSRANVVDYRVTTLSGFTKNITASSGENLNDVAVLGTEDGFIKILDLTARKVVRTIKAHASGITSICCIGKNAMCVSSVDGTLTLWNTQDFTRLSVLRGHRHKVSCCCFDPAGYIVYSSGWDNTVRLWSSKDGRPITVIENFACPVSWIDHHPLKQQIACGLWNGNIEIWDTVSIQKKTVMESSNGSVQSLAYTRDGVNLVASYINSEISIWSSEEGLKVFCLKGHILPVKTLTSLLYDNILISGSDDCTLKVWSTVHKSQITVIEDTKSCPINLIELISENRLAVAFQNGEIWVFDINNGKMISKTSLDMDIVTVISTNVKLKGLQIDEKFLVFGTGTGKLMVEDIEASSVSVKEEFHSKITAVIHNSEIIVCGTSAGDIGIYNRTKGTSETVHSAHKGFIGAFCFSQQDEKLYLLSSASDNVLKLWNVKWNDCEISFENEFLNKHRDAITFCLFHSPLPNSASLKGLLTGSYDNNVILWDDESVKTFGGLQSSVMKIAYSGDSILGCGNDGALVMWHKNGAVLTNIPGIKQSSAILSFHVQEDVCDKFAVTLAYVELDGSIKIDKPLQLSYSTSLDGHSRPITSCCGTESQEIVSCSLDGSVNLWRVPVDAPDEHFRHETSVTGLLLADSMDFALTSDADGNLVLWKVDLEISNSPLTYAGKKKYDQGFIKGLCWFKDKQFACFVSQVIENEEKHFLDIIMLKDSPQKTALCLEVTRSFPLKSEVSCFDCCEQTEGIIVGLRCGNVMYITTEAEHCYQMSDDWILGVCFHSSSQPSDRFCISSIDGCVSIFSIKNLQSSKESLPKPVKTYQPPDSNESSKFSSAMCFGRGLICCGDSDGMLRIYDQNSLTVIKKVHDDLISGMCVIDSYLFTCSLDKTVKGWNLNSFKQVCQFHSSTPITYLTSAQSNSKASGQHSKMLLIGTTSGSVHLLQFHTG